MMNFITQNITDWFTANYDPFYGYCAEAALLALAVTAAAWYFPVLRSLSGAIVFAVIAALIGYRKAEGDDAKREKAAADLKKVDTPPTNWW